MNSIKIEFTLLQVGYCGNVVQPNDILDVIVIHYVVMTHKLIPILNELTIDQQSYDDRHQQD